MPGKTISNLKKLQRNQFNKVTKDKLIDAILSADDVGETWMEKQDEKLKRILEELADIWCKMAEGENENKARIKDMAEKIERQSAIIMQHQLFMEQVDR